MKNMWGNSWSVTLHAFVLVAHETYDLQYLQPFYIWWRPNLRRWFFPDHLYLCQPFSCKSGPRFTKNWKNVFLVDNWLPRIYARWLSLRCPLYCRQNLESWRCQLVSIPIHLFLYLINQFLIANNCTLRIRQRETTTVATIIYHH